MSDEGQSDQFNGRLGLIFASIGAAIGTGNIWRFPRIARKSKIVKYICIAFKQVRPAIFSTIKRLKTTGWAGQIRGTGKSH